MDERGRFRWVGYAEGVSFLVLLGVAMPLKYIAGWPMGVKVVGWAHGVLFVAYMFFALQLGQSAGWGWKKHAGAFAASLLPFGPFIFDRILLADEEKK